MADLPLRAWMATLAALILAAPVVAQDEDREGGIIGTGIAGTITELGSIIVNGQRILIDETAEVIGSAPPIAAADLRPGHIVAVSVQPDGDDWRAVSIRQILPLVGPVESVDATDFVVMGTRVVSPDPLTGLNVGDWVAVSGLWRDQKVLASQVDPVPEAHHQARVSGTYFGETTDANLAIGDTVIGGVTPQHLEAGKLMRVFGTPVPGGIDANRLESYLFDDPVGLVQIEGYFSKPRPDGLYTVLGSGLVAYTDQPEMIDPRDRVVRCGEDGRLNAVSSDPGQDDALQQILERLGCG